MKYPRVESKMIKMILFPHYNKVRDKRNLNTAGSTEVVVKLTLLGNELDIATIGLKLAFAASLDVFLTLKRSETPLVGDDDLLLTRELVLAATKSFNDSSLVGVLGTDREDHLTNVDTSNETLGLTKGTTHTLLQSIGTSTRQHLVDTNNVERMDTNTHVERILARVLDNVLVSTDTTSFQGFRRKLFVLVRDQVNAKRKVVNVSLLATQVIDSDLGVRDTTAVSALGIGLVLAVTVATSGTATHG